MITFYRNNIFLHLLHHNYILFLVPLISGIAKETNFPFDFIAERVRKEI